MKRSWLVFDKRDGGSSLLALKQSSYATNPFTMLRTLMRLFSLNDDNSNDNSVSSVMLFGDVRNAYRDHRAAPKVWLDEVEF